MAHLPPAVSQALLAWKQARSSASPPESTALAPEREEPALGRPSGAAGVHRQGVHRAGGAGRRYQASTFCLNLLIAAAPVASLEEAICQHTALVMLRAEMAGLRETADAMGVEAVAAKFEGALESACASAGVAADVLCLSFRPVVSALGEVGKQITGLRTSDVRTALRQRAELLEAKAAGWEALRPVWVGILAQAKGAEAAEAMGGGGRRSLLSCHAWRAPGRHGVALQGTRNVTSRINERCELSLAIVLPIALSRQGSQTADVVPGCDLAKQVPGWRSRPLPTPSLRRLVLAELVRVWD